jgi:hypothetical protein
MFYALVHDQPKIMSKVNLFVAFAPIARIAGVQDFSIISDHMVSVESVAHGINLNEIFDQNFKTSLYEAAGSPFGQWIGAFKAVVSAIKGEFDDPERSLVASARFPTQTSMKSLFHFG